MSEIITENSLYSTQAERDDLIKDKRKLMDAILFNFLGFVGLYKMGNRGYMKTYRTTEGKLQLQSISDSNHDVSLVIKLGVDAGLIRTNIAMQITKFLFLIRSQKIAGKDIDDDKIREFVKGMRVLTNRPSPRMAMLVNQFSNGTLDLRMLTKEMYRLAKMPDYKPVTIEFRQLVMKGNYLPIFAKLPQSLAATTTGGATTGTTNDGASDTAPAATTATASATKGSVTPKATRTTKIAKAQSTLSGPALFKEISSADSKPKLDAILKINGVTKSKFPFKEFLNWASKASDDIIKLSVRTHPFWGLLNGKGSKELSMTKSEYILKLEVRIADAIWDKIIKDPTDIIANAELADKIRFQKEDGVSRQTRHKRADLFKFVLSTISQRSIDLFKKFDPNSLAKSILTLYTAIGKMTSYYPFELGITPSPAALLTIALPYNVDPSAGVLHLLDFTENALGEKLAEALGLDINDIEMLDRRSVQIILSEDKLKSLSPDAQFVIRYIASLGRQIGYMKKVNIVITSGDKKSILSSVIKTELLPLVKLRETLEKLGVPFNGLSDAEKKMIADKITNPDQVFDWARLSAKDPEFNLPANKSMFSEILSFVDIDNHSATVVGFVSSAGNPDLRKKHLDRFGKISNFDKLAEAIQDPQYRFLSFALKNAIALSKEDISEILEYALDNQDKLNIGGSRKSAIQLVDFYLGEAGIKRISFTQAEALDFFKENYKSGIRKLLAKKYDSIRNYILESFRTELDLKFSEFMGLRKSYMTLELIAPNFPDWLVDNFKTTLKSTKTDEISYLMSIKPEFWRNPELSSLLQLISEEVRTRIQNKEPLKNGSALAIIELFPAAEVVKMIARGDLKNALWAIKERDARQINFFYKEMTNKHADLTIEAMKVLVDNISEQISENKKNFPKSTRDSCINSIAEILGLWQSDGRTSEADIIFAGMKGDAKRAVVSYFTNFSVLARVNEKLMEAPVKPLTKIETRRIPDILKYNNIKLPHQGHLRKITSITAMMKTADVFKDNFKDLAVTKIERTPEEMKQRSVEFDVFNKYRHGKIALEFLEEFDVDLDVQRDGFEEWVSARPSTKQMDPVFHGTGSIAASFILRYGFSVIKATDASCVGRMLGDGIYFSNVLDKVAQYVSDGGYHRGIGTEGYIFQMKAALGETPENYRAAGLGRDSIRSPEWCVFEPNHQLRIYKAYKVRIISKDTMDKMKGDLNINENTAVPIKSFSNFLKEERHGEHVTSFTFIDGNIPISETEYVPFEEFRPEDFGAHVSLDISALGPVVYINHDGEESQTFAVRFTSEYMHQPELQDFLNLLRKQG